ncbi:PREDICTED: uncharacterized protein LOC108759250 [Trachymyrmex cornetzi]|uniref:uncharacterized protein LOC108759250 n=1 Tax=Trachymyrmex cornetzi TaxID=471704 RepID=UPI00084EEC77|nr:PREDICTED: uncharacterized protein LOC108759250 [Trachymyrmex cornetzi]
MEANACSPLWQSGSSDIKGLKLEGFLALSRWFVVNEEGFNHTFTSTNGVSNIDVTLSSPSLYPLIGNWKVEVRWTNSDHRVLVTMLKSAECSCVIREARFNITRANWKAFREKFNAEAGNLEWSVSDKKHAEVRACQITEAIRSAGKAAIPRKNKFGRSVPWCNEGLTRLKGGVNGARRRFQREKEDAARFNLKHNYMRLRKTYTAEVTRAKNQSWKDFVSK